AMGVEADPRAGEILLGLARAAIAAGFGSVARADDSAAWLADPGAVFVTLTLNGRLRGCIGTIEPHRSLARDVTHNARAAAFSDPRFPPLTAAELPRIRIEVSLLSPTEPLPAGSETDLLGRLRPGIDGLVLSWDGHRGTFLPQVWGQLPDRQEFLNRLKLKAGLPASFWNPDVKVRRFAVTAWAEPDPDQQEVTR
ncbi:MAG: AmmeMemoRadiSam system protein A, partial [Propionicimonas sp.]